MKPCLLRCSQVLALGLLWLPAAPTLAASPAVAASAATAAAATATALAQARGKPAAHGEAARLHALFDRHWQWTLNEFPEWATYLGEHRHDDRWTDKSPAALDRRDRQVRDWLALARRIDPRRLQGEDRVSLEVFIHEQVMAVEHQRYPVLRTRVLSAIDGLHLELGELVRAMPMRTEADARRVLARLKAFPARMNQDLALLRQGRAQGWVTHRASLEKVPEQIDGQLLGDGRASPLFGPFAELLADARSELPAALRAELAAAAQGVIEQAVRPALVELRRLVLDELLPAAPVSGAMSDYPGGAAIYKLRMRDQTTLELQAQAVHELGLREVARLRAEMEALIARTGFGGSFAAFVDYLNTDPKFFYTRAEDLLAGYRELAKRVDPMLTAQFAQLPRTPYGIRAIPAYQGEGTSEYYTQGTADGTRPAWFNANVVALKTRPKWEMEALFLHEAVPGHHLQSARALELGELPMFRRAGWYVAYGEGWALYAEGLGEALGLYTDPHAKFGQLRLEIWRAARLVVDTGMHALGWSRERAIDWMVERGGIARADVVAEVDRYIAWPAQALGYKIGQLKIVELRERARKALGARFDIRRFHMAVLDHGAVPLPVLERLIDAWITAESGRPAPAAAPTTISP